MRRIQSSEMDILLNTYLKMATTWQARSTALAKSLGDLDDDQPGIAAVWLPRIHEELQLWPWGWFKEVAVSTRLAVSDHCWTLP